MKKLTSLLLTLVLVFSLSASLAEETAFQAGAWEGNVFTSAFAGYTFTLPEGMSAMDETTLGALTAQVPAEMAGSINYDLAVMSPLGDIAFVMYIGGENQEAFVKAQEAAFAGAEAEEAELFGQTFQKMTLSMNMGEITLNMGMYFRVVGDQVEMITINAMSDDALTAIEGAFAPIAE